MFARTGAQRGPRRVDRDQNHRAASLDFNWRLMCLLFGCTVGLWTHLLDRFDDPLERNAEVPVASHTK